jgi:uncharacterized membrane protein YkvA (DUF1232 family)
MTGFFDFLSTAMWCGTVLGLAFMVVLALPKSEMREVMKKVLFAVACALYVLSPIDFMPEAILGPLGFVDDLGAMAAGIMSLKSAIRMGA